MKHFLTKALLCAIALAGLWLPSGEPAFAQTVIIPAKPAGAQESYDRLAIEALVAIGTRIVEMAKITRDAQTGTRTVPFDSPVIPSGKGPKEIVDDLLSDAGLAGSDKDIVEDYKKKYNIGDTLTNKDTDQMTKSMTAQGLAASLVAEKDFKAANASLDRMDDYVKALQNSTDLKSSVDLNTRVMIELTTQINLSIHTQAMTASIAGAFLVSFSGASSGGASLIDTLENLNR
jgi:hypothetical protein